MGVHAPCVIRNARASWSCALNSVQSAYTQAIRNGHAETLLLGVLLTITVIALPCGSENAIQIICLGRS